MPKVKQKAISIEEVTIGLTAALRRASIRPTITGYRPMKHQILFHSAPQTGRLFIGGNRSGKTVSGATETIKWLTGKHDYLETPRPPVYGRGIASDFDHGVDMIMKPEIARWLPPSELIKGSWEESYNRTLRTLTLANGSTFEFMSNEQDIVKFAGTSRNFCWFDEEPAEEVFNENLARLIDVGGRWWITMTPLEGMSWTYDRLFQAQKVDKNIAVIQAAMDMNIHINVAEIDQYLSGMTKEEKQARRQGRYVQMGGLIYNKYFGEKNIIKPIVDGPHWPEFQKKWLHFAGMDHGFNNPTCWLWACTDEEGRIVVYDEYYVEKEVVSTHAYNILERESSFDVDIGYRVGDPSIRNTDPITGTSVQLEYIEQGVSIVPGNNDVSAGIVRVARLFESGQILITENCEKLIWELGRYRWAKWSTKRIEGKNNPKDVPVKKDDHACDALRYLVASRFSMEVDTPSEPSNIMGVPEAVLVGAVTLDKDLQEQGPMMDEILGADW